MSKWTKKKPKKIIVQEEQVPDPVAEAIAKLYPWECPGPCLPLVHRSWMNVIQ